MRFDRNQLLVRGVRLLMRAEQGRLGGAVDVRVDQADLLSRLGERDGEVGRNGRLADSTLAATDCDQRPVRLRRGHGDASIADAGQSERRCTYVLLDPL